MQSICLFIFWGKLRPEEFIQDPKKWKDQNEIRCQSREDKADLMFLVVSQWTPEKSLEPPESGVSFGFGSKPGPFQ